jgi:hypothetical protein
MSNGGGFADVVVTTQLGGTSAANQRRLLLLCNPGYAFTAYQASCLACPTGYTSSTYGALNCTACPAGSACPFTNGTNAASCGHGYYSVGGATVCCLDVLSITSLETESFICTGMHVL